MIKKESVGLQLYSVREALAEDFDGTMRRIAAMGYTAVETAGFTVTPKQAKALFDTLGLTVCGAHVPLPLGEDKNSVMETIATYECDYVICPVLRPDEYWEDVESIKRAADMLNEANEVVQAADKKMVYHNHWWEAALIDDKPAYQYLAENTDESVLFEVDTYWMRTGGLDPLDVIQYLGDRAPLIHLKDGPAEQKASMVALGEGVMDIDAILKASDAEWYIVELDRCDTDMMEAVENSYQYLAGKFS